MTSVRWGSVYQPGGVSLQMSGWCAGSVTVASYACPRAILRLVWLLLAGFVRSAIHGVSELVEVGAAQVDLGAGQVDVSEHFLDGAGIAAAVENVGGAGVTEGVPGYSVWPPSHAGAVDEDGESACDGGGAEVLAGRPDNFSRNWRFKLRDKAGGCRR